MNKHFIQKYFDNDILNIKKITGGVSNYVYLVETKNSLFIFKYYGELMNNLINRNNEVMLLSYLDELSIVKFFPKIEKKFDKGRIEKYLGNTEPDKLHKKYSKQIIEVVKQLHTIKVPSFLENFWDRFDSWKKQTNNFYDKEISIVINKLKGVSFWNKNVIGHGDLTEGNILKNESIYLIDFEYSCKMPIGFDLGNFLCEYNGIDACHPSDEIIEKIVKIYKGSVCKEDIEILNLYCLISHFYWGCWGIIQSKSNISFDYISYSEKRFALFRENFKKMV